LNALAGRCDLDILIVAQLNRGAYGSSSGPDVSHLAGTSELERYASAVWLIDRPKPGDGPPATALANSRRSSICWAARVCAGIGTVARLG
jgi:hypothetical protein